MFKRTLLISAGIFFIFTLLVGGNIFAYQKIYQGRVYPGVYVGDYPLGGLKEEEIKNVIENINNRYSREGLDFTVLDREGRTNKVKLQTVLDGDNAVEVVRLESAPLIKEALQTGRTGTVFSKLLMPFFFRFYPERLRAPVYFNEKIFVEALKNQLANFEDRSHNAAILVTAVIPLKYSVVQEKNGLVFNYPKIISQVKQALEVLSFSPITLNLEEFSASITAREVEEIAPRLQTVFNYGPLGLNYLDPETLSLKTSKINSDELAQQLSVEKDNDGGLIFALAEDKLKKYLAETIGPAVNRLPQDAKFVMTNGKVEEFQESRSGLALNVDATAAKLRQIFQERNYAPVALNQSIDLAVDSIEPKVKTAEVNNLGIVEILGAGTSTFKNSHNNRIKNIAHAVKLLNGVLIKPGEEFSANRYAGPYTAENGYLPEQVIKGRELKLEIGGGMCQIGTTLFRMAMNSGLEITERRNHSLVVGYYADPVNGNPGTDATLYDPVLDFKFKNDTGNYLLLQTSIDYRAEKLTFILWGKSDGRRGWYNHPTVLKWIPAGKPQQILSDDGALKVGEEKCQNAFLGAVAKFIYTRVTPAGEKKERVFDSYYRPLPKICTIGVEKGTVTSTTASPTILIPGAP